MIGASIMKELIMFDRVLKHTSLVGNLNAINIILWRHNSFMMTYCRQIIKMRYRDQNIG